MDERTIPDSPALNGRIQGDCLMIARTLKMASHFLRYRFRKLHPFEVQALLTDDCDLKCVYCACPTRKTPMMTTEQWLETIRGLASFGTMRIKFQGGEPTH